MAKLSVSVNLEAQRIILRELRRKFKYVVEKGSGVWTLCCLPSHNGRDTSPSLKFNIDPQNDKAPLGHCYCFGCLHPDEVIRTKRGAVASSEVRVGDKVYDILGNLEPVTHTERHAPTHPVMHVYVAGTNMPLKVTTNHDMLVIPNTQVLKSRYKLTDIKDMPAAHVGLGDLVVFPLTLGLDMSHRTYWDVSRYIVHNVKGPQKNRVRITSLPLDNEAMWVYGMYIANGSTSRGSIRFSINIEKVDEERRITAFLRRLGLRSTTFRYVASNLMEVVASSTDLQHIFEGLFGKGAANKRAPQWMLHLSLDQLWHLRDGILEDGHEKVDVTLISPAAVDFAVHASLLLGDNVRTQYREGYVQESDGIYRRPTYGISIRHQTIEPSYIKVLIEGRPYAAFPVTALVYDVPQPEYVCDITVANSHTMLTRIGAVGNCGGRMHWNDFATQFGLATISALDQEVVERSEVRGKILRLRDRAVDRTLLDIASEWGARMLHDPADSWRGVSPRLLNFIGGKLFVSRQTEPRMLLPVSVQGDLIGAVNARMAKSSDKSVPSYLNSEGTWAKSLGLFPYDSTRQLMGKWQTRKLVLSEGPRDALNGLQYKIPTLAVLGVKNWSHKKRDLILSLDPSELILCMDSDKAGVAATNMLLQEFERYCPTRFVNMKQHAASAGLDKLDLGEATDAVLDELQLAVYGH